jgi:hypothetical protein
MTVKRRPQYGLAATATILAVCTFAFIAWLMVRSIAQIDLIHQQQRTVERLQEQNAELREALASAIARGDADTLQGPPGQPPLGWTYRDHGVEYRCDRVPDFDASAPRYHCVALDTE